MSKKTVNPKLNHKAPQSKTPPVLLSANGSAWAQRNLPWILMVALLLFVSLLYYPVAFGGKAPQASDISQWRGAANEIIEYNKANKDDALWTQRMFSGMPSYMISFPNKYPFLENLSRLTDKVINWRIFLLFIGALGVFLLFRFLKMDVWTSLLGAVAFMFSCHWLGLVEIGHNTKFRAIMYIPWVVWALMYLRQKPGLLGLGFLASMLVMQLRENHPQITYYLYLFIGMYWVWQLIESLREKQLKRFGIFTGLLIVAFGLTVLAVMNPYMSTMEYSHYTMRGGASGLETSYAQGWSFHPLEILTLIIPDFYGGVHHLENGQPVSNYWGYMSSTQIYNYFGLVVLALGVFAYVGRKHRRMAIFLGSTSFIFLLMSFGSATPALSDLFLKYLPYFNKFRVPSMILTMVQINAVLLAGLGVDTILQATESENKRWIKGLFKAFWITGAVFLLWLVAAKALFGGLSFASARDLAELTKYNLQEMPAQAKAERLDLLYKSGILSLLFLTVSMGLLYLRSIHKLSKLAFSLLLIAVVFIDLYVYTGRNLKSENLAGKEEREVQFTMQQYDQDLLADKSNYRIYPITASPYAGIQELSQYITSPYLNRQSGEWAYYHQTIDGYSSAKLKRYDKCITNDPNPIIKAEWFRYWSSLLQGEEKPTPMLDMLSVKYILHPDSIIGGSYTKSFTPLNSYSDGARENLYIYRNNNALPRAWFVQSVQKVTPADSIISFMRKESFDPRKVAFVETDIKGIQAPDSTATVKQTISEMHKLAYDVKTDKPSFLVLSEVYYPAGWKATLDGKEIPIHPTNYILRGVEIPAGPHKLELVFAPDSYKKSITLSLIGLLVSFLALAVGAILAYLKRKQTTVENL